MDRFISSPEQRTPDLLHTAFDRAMHLVITYGAIDAEYENPYHNEQYPRLNRRGQHASSFELKATLKPDETYRANMLELYYTDEYIDEEGQLNEAGRLLVTLRYPEGYARDIWLKLQPDGSIKTEVRLDMALARNREEFEMVGSDVLSEQKEAVLQALSEGDDSRLTELIDTDPELRLYAERVMTSVGPHSFSEIGVEEFEELRHALTQAEAAL